MFSILKGCFLVSPFHLNIGVWNMFSKCYRKVMPTTSIQPSVGAACEPCPVQASLGKMCKLCGQWWWLRWWFSGSCFLKPQASFLKAFFGISFWNNFEDNLRPAWRNKNLFRTFPLVLLGIEFFNRVLGNWKREFLYLRFSEDAISLWFSDIPDTCSAICVGSSLSLFPEVRHSTSHDYGSRNR